MNILLLDFLLFKVRLSLFFYYNGAMKIFIQSFFYDCFSRLKNTVLKDTARLYSQVVLEGYSSWICHIFVRLASKALSFFCMIFSKMNSEESWKITCLLEQKGDMLTLQYDNVSSKLSKVLLQYHPLYRQMFSGPLCVVLWELEFGEPVQKGWYSSYCYYYE